MGDEQYIEATYLDGIIVVIIPFETNGILEVEAAVRSANGMINLVGDSVGNCKDNECSDPLSSIGGAKHLAITLGLFEVLLSCCSLSHSIIKLGKGAVMVSF